MKNIVVFNRARTCWWWDPWDPWGSPSPDGSPNDIQTTSQTRDPQEGWDRNAARSRWSNRSSLAWSAKDLGGSWRRWELKGTEWNWMERKGGLVKIGDGIKMGLSTLIEKKHRFWIYKNPWLVGWLIGWLVFIIFFWILMRSLKRWSFWRPGHNWEWPSKIKHAGNYGNYLHILILTWWSNSS